MEESDLNNRDQATGRSGRRQLKPRDDPKLLAKICELHFRLDKTYQEIIATFKGVKGVSNPPQVSKLIRDARQQGVIFFDIDETFALRGTELTQEGRELSEQFELGHTLVIDVRPYEETTNELFSNDGKDKESVMRADDYLHTVLANHAGLLLKHQFITDDHIALAGGRAVNQAV